MSKTFLLDQQKNQNEPTATRMTEQSYEATRDIANQKREAFKEFVTKVLYQEHGNHRLVISFVPRNAILIYYHGLNT